MTLEDCELRFQMHRCRWRVGWMGFNLPGIWGFFQQEGADYAHPVTACPPGFENLTTSEIQFLSLSTISIELNIYSCKEEYK